jgi:glycosyltransferase involved in cell wall biosynthesis
LRRITVSHPEHSFFFLFDRPFSGDFIFSDNVTPLIIGPQARHPLLFIWWFEWSLPPVLKSLNPDLFLSPDGFLSLKAPVKSLPVIHDINFHHYPKDLSKTVAAYYNHYFPRFAAKADYIATVSEFSRRDIAATYHIPEEKIGVVYNGVSEGFASLDEASRKQVREQYTGGVPYFFYVGSLQPRKNLAVLMKAFDRFKAQSGLDFKLILAGSKYLWDREMESVFRASPHRQDILLPGRLPEKELHRLMASAHALTYVPKYEGFGIPVIEAMASGVPVIASEVSSIPEVSADAAMLCKADDVQSIASAMLRLASDEVFRARLIADGLQRHQRFTWNDTAHRLWQCMEKTMGIC